MGSAMQKVGRIMRLSAIVAPALLSACSMDVGQLQLNGQVEPLPGNYRELISAHLRTDDWEVVSASRFVPGSSVLSKRRPIVCVREGTAVSAVLFESGTIIGTVPAGPEAPLCR